MAGTGPGATKQRNQSPQTGSQRPWMQDVTAHDPSAHAGHTGGASHSASVLHDGSTGSHVNAQEPFTQVERAQVPLAQGEQTSIAAQSASPPQVVDPHAGWLGEQ